MNSLEVKVKTLEKGIFVTGTDTGVGKTLVASGLARLLKDRGVDVGVMKPVATGAKRLSDRLLSEDARMLMQAARCEDPYPIVNPICLHSPLAPTVAARVDRRPIELERIWTAFEALKKRHDFLIVEGIGGLLVPLGAGFYVVDMAKRMKLPILIVSRPCLGTINHTLLTIEAARRRRLSIKGIILNHTMPPADDRLGRLRRTARAEIERCSGVSILATIPFIPGPKGPALTSTLSTLVPYL